MKILASWYNFTGNTIEKDGQTLQEFEYAIAFAEKNVGDIGGYAYDSDCLKDIFISTNSFFMKGSRARNGCIIENSTIAMSEINGRFHIRNSNLVNAKLLSDKDPNFTHLLKIEETTISGTEAKEFSICCQNNTSLNIGKTLLESEGNTTTSCIHIETGGGLTLDNCRVLIKNAHKPRKSGIAIKENAYLSATACSFLDSSVVVRSAKKAATKNINNFSDTQIYGEIIAQDEINIKNSTFSGIIINKENNRVKIRGSHIYKDASILCSADNCDIAIVCSELSDSSSLVVSGSCETVSLSNSTLHDIARIEGSEDEIITANCSLRDSSRVENSIIHNVSLFDSAVVKNTNLRNSKVYGKSVVGEYVPAKLFKKTDFEDLLIEDKSDFFIFPVIANKYYYIVSDGGRKIYRLIDNETPFTLINFDSEVKWLLERISNTSHNSPLCNDTLDYDIIRKKSQKYCERKLCSMENIGRNMFFMRYFSSLCVLRLLAHAAFMSYLDDDQYDWFNEKIEKFTNCFSLFDMKKNKIVFNSNRIVFFPAFSFLFFEDNCLEPSFKEIANKKENILVV